MDDSKSCFRSKQRVKKGPDSETRLTPHAARFGFGPFHSLVEAVLLLLPFSKWLIGLRSGESLLPPI